MACREGGGDSLHQTLNGHKVAFLHAVRAIYTKRRSTNVQSIASHGFQVLKNSFLNTDIMGSNYLQGRRMSSACT